MDGYRVLAEFCNSSFTEFTPRSPEKQRAFECAAQAHRRCMHLLVHGQEQSWSALEARFQVEQDRKIAGQFYRHLGRLGRRSAREDSSPVRVLQQLRSDVQQFDRLSPQIFNPSGSRDLLKLDEAADLIGNYHGSQERTFAFLFVLPGCLEPDARKMLEGSHGYAQIIRWGATPFVREFWHRLQQRFRLTRVAIKNEAAQNLARELGETETTLLDEIERLNERIAELEATLEGQESAGLRRAVCDLVRNLQSRPTPILDQARSLYLRLRLQADGDPGLDTDHLSILIIVEELLAALAEQGVEAFPVDTTDVFEIRGDELGQYQYLRGSEFASDGDVKRVCCVHAGWRVGDEIITPAVVEEAAAEKEGGA